MKTITTKYHGPTNVKGARISATDGENGKIYIAYPHELDTAEAHALAAKTFRDKMGWKGEMVGGHIRGGMVFVFTEDPSPRIAAAR